MATSLRLSRSRRLARLGAALLGLFSAIPAPAETFAPKVLAAPALCEASAALFAPWDESLLLVADNERNEQLYAFSVQGEELVSKPVLPIPGEKRANDVEALARLGNDVMVVGSHSRSSKCKDRPERQRLQRLRRRGDGTLEVPTTLIDSATTWKTAMAGGVPTCLSVLFTKPASAAASEVCEALVAAEKAVASDAAHCGVLNIEGALGLGGRLWLGLRAPLAGKRAVLLRLADGNAELRFDRAALLDLEGRGIRELAVDGDQVYGLAGPTLDAPDPFALFKLSAALLDGGEPAVQILRRDLVSSSEGLAIRGGRAYVLVDGDQGEGSGGCKVPAKWYSFPLS